MLDWDALTDEVCRRHGAHTVILYGSRARGDSTERSDVDLLAFRASGGADRDVERWRGWEIDLHLHDEERVATLAREHASSYVDARVLRQREGWGDRFLAAVRARLAEPAPALAEGERAALWAWGDKMRGR